MKWSYWAIPLKNGWTSSVEATTKNIRQFYFKTRKAQIVTKQTASPTTWHYESRETVSRRPDENVHGPGKSSQGNATDTSDETQKIKEDQQKESSPTINNEVTKGSNKQTWASLVCSSQLMKYVGIVELTYLLLICLLYNTNYTSFIIFMVLVTQPTLLYAGDCFMARYSIVTVISTVSRLFSTLCFCFFLNAIFCLARTMN